MTDGEKREIKPCPFCGSDTISILIARSSQWYRIVCEACGGAVITDPCECDDGTTGSILRDLLDTWNRRMKE